MLLCLCLHPFAPCLQPLGLVVKELHKPAAVPAEGGYSACVGALQAGFNQPGFRLRAGWPTGRPVVLPVTEKALCAHRTDRSILCWRAGLRVAAEGTTELQTFILHGGKSLQLHVCLHCSGHTVGALEPPMPTRNTMKCKDSNWDLKKCTVTLSFISATYRFLSSTWIPIEWNWGRPLVSVSESVTVSTW